MMNINKNKTDDFIIIDFESSNIKFDILKYNTCKEYSSEREYMLHYLLQQNFVNILSKFQISDSKILIIKNCPIDQDLPLSPIKTGYLDGNNFPVVKDFMLCIYQIMNLIPYAYKYENNGKIFRSVVPIINEKDMIGSYGSKIAFNYHSDNPTYKIYPEYEINSLNSPQFLSLYCLRGMDNVYTKIIVLNDVIKQLDNSDIEILKSNSFVVNTPDSFDVYHEVKNVCAIAYKSGRYYTRFDYHNLHSNDENINRILLKFKNILKTTKCISISFKSGDFLIFKNQEVLHSRESFNPKFDGKDRWLIRIYGANNMNFLRNKEIILGEE